MPAAPNSVAQQFELFGLFEPAAPAAGRTQRRFVHGAHSFTYELRRASRRSIGIRIDEAAVRVSAPRWVSLGQIEQVLADKAAWVLQQLQLREQRLREQRCLRVDWVDGAYRGIGVRKSTPAAERKRISDLWRALNNDAEMKELAARSGFELVNVGVEDMDSFMAAKTKLYTEGAARMGLGKK